MPTFIIMMNWTEQGIHNVKDAPKRAAVFLNETATAGAREIRGAVQVRPAGADAPATSRFVT